MSDTNKAAAVMNAIYEAGAKPARVISWLISIGLEAGLEHLDERANNSNRNLIYELSRADAPQIDPAAHPSVADTFRPQLESHKGSVDALGKRLDADPDGYSDANVTAVRKLVADGTKLSESVKAALQAEQERLKTEKAKLETSVSKLSVRIAEIATDAEIKEFAAAAGKIMGAFAGSQLTTPMVRTAEEALKAAEVLRLTLENNAMARESEKERIVQEMSALPAKLAAGKLSSDVETLKGECDKVLKAFKAGSLTPELLENATKMLENAQLTVQDLNQKIANRLQTSQQINDALSSIDPPGDAEPADTKILVDAKDTVKNMLAGEITDETLDEAQAALDKITAADGPLSTIKANIFQRSVGAAASLIYPEESLLVGTEPVILQQTRDRVKTALAGDKLSDEARSELANSVEAAEVTIKDFARAIKEREAAARLEAQRQQQEAERAAETKRRNDAESATKLWESERQRLYGQIPRSLSGGSPPIASKDVWMKRLDMMLKTTKTAIEKTGWTEESVQKRFTSDRDRLNAGWAKSCWDFAETQVKGRANFNLSNITRQSLWTFFGYKGLRGSDWTVIPRRAQDDNTTPRRRALHLTLSADAMSDPTSLLQNITELQKSASEIFDRLFLLSNKGMRVHTTREAFDNPKIATRQHVFLGDEIDGLDETADAYDVAAMKDILKEFRADIEGRIAEAKANGWKNI